MRCFILVLDCCSIDVVAVQAMSDWANAAPQKASVRMRRSRVVMVFLAKERPIRPVKILINLIMSPLVVHLVHYAVKERNLDHATTFGGEESCPYGLSCNALFGMFVGKSSKLEPSPGEYQPAARKSGDGRDAMKSLVIALLLAACVALAQDTKVTPLMTKDLAGWPAKKPLW
jgi:hypothetical protein